MCARTILFVSPSRPCSAASKRVSCRHRCSFFPRLQEESIERRHGMRGVTDRSASSAASIDPNLVELVDGAVLRVIVTSMRNVKVSEGYRKRRRIKNSLYKKQWCQMRTHDEAPFAFLQHVATRSNSTQKERVLLVATKRSIIVTASWFPSIQLSCLPLTPLRLPIERFSSPLPPPSAHLSPTPLVYHAGLSLGNFRRP
jgi:hypothetical protein